MINYIEKGRNLHIHINEQGYKLWNEDGVFKSDNDAAVQAIIDNFDPLPLAQNEALELIDKSAGQARLRYAPDELLAEEYRITKEQALAYQVDNSNIGSALQTAADYEDLTIEQAAAKVLAESAGLTFILEGIRALRLAGKKMVKAQTDWTQCAVIAEGVKTQIEAI